MKKVSKRFRYILAKSIRGLGKIGDIANVAPGYGRFLSKTKTAIAVTSESLENLEKNKSIWKQHELENEKKAIVLIESINNLGKVFIKKKVNQTQDLYESIRVNEIVEVLANRGINLDKSYIRLKKPIKKVGEFEILVSPYGDLITKLILVVQGE